MAVKTEGTISQRQALLSPTDFLGRRDKQYLPCDTSEGKQLHGFCVARNLF